MVTNEIWSCVIVLRLWLSYSNRFVENVKSFVGDKGFPFIIVTAIHNGHFFLHSDNYVFGIYLVKAIIIHDLMCKLYLEKIYS